MEMLSFFAVMKTTTKHKKAIISLNADALQ